jgi:hypothetical protein
MIDSKKLLADLQSKTGSRTTMVKRLEDHLRARCDADPAVDAPLQAQYADAFAKKRTALTYKAWREEELTQVAVAWVLGCVFVRFLEDNELVETPKLAGPGARLQRARDEHDLYFHRQPQDNTDRGYLIEVFEEAGRLPGMREFFDKKHNPLWLAAPSGDACRELLQFWQKTDPVTGALLHDFTDPDWNTRFLGDLYQDLSEAARKKYALLQTPDFIESFILDRTLTPAIETFGYKTVRLIDPTCGSGHFLLGTFARLFRIWQDECPGENPRVLAQRALDGVYGVDLNPFAVAIARFRLLLAALQVSGIKRLKDAPDFVIHVAAGDSLLHGRRFRQLEGETRRQSLFETDEEIFRDELKHHYEVEDTNALHRILGQQYHAVVGNPPYITVKDKAVSELYRERFPSCSGKYALSVPFMERFFDLAVKGDGTPQQPAGFVGQITANSFMKREFGKKLIEEYLPRWDLTHVLDTSGAYIPGHGTPTVILLGKNQPPVSGTIRTVLGIRGEPAAPAEPSLGLVWQAILIQIDKPGSVSEWVSTADSPRTNFHQHPWSIGGGGAAELKELLEQEAEYKLSTVAADWGITSVTGADDFFVAAAKSDLDRLRIEMSRPYVTGVHLRDWTVNDPFEAIWMYDSDLNVAPLESRPFTQRLAWHFRTILSTRRRFGTPMIERGYNWFEWQELYPAKLRTPIAITFACVATHNQFVLSQVGHIFKNHAPVIKLPPAASVEEHVLLIGVLNSSSGCFWMKQGAHNKGDSTDQHGARTTGDVAFNTYEFTAGQIVDFPIPACQPTQLPTALVQTSTAPQAHSPTATLASWGGPESGDLRPRLASAHDLATGHRRQIIAWQEELDWQIYEAFGLVEGGAESTTNAVSLPEGAAVDAIPPEGIELGQRAFEIVLARRMAAGEVQTTWFARHGSTPITEVPSHWPAAYRELVERRIARIESDSNLRLIEQPEYKRRWNTESWEKSQQEALRQWLLARLEGYFHEGSRVCDLAGSFDPAAHGFTAAARPHLVSANQLADVVQSDARFLEAAEVYVGAVGFSVPRLVQDLVESESVPALPRDRYKDSGLRKRQDWEETWRLQRLEDAVEEEVRGQNPETSEEQLKPLIRKAQVEKVGDIPVPPKYASTDFKKASHWKLRGKLDVPKERWIHYPGAERAGDDSPLIAWAGWDHLQQAQALAEYFIDAQTNQGWPPARLKPLLAALADLIPWLKQWHNAYDPAYGTGLGDYFASFLEEQCRALGMTVQEVDAVRFEASPDAAPARARKQAKQRAASGKVDE